MVPFISVIIPAHNEENYLRQTLHSLKNQAFQDFEVVVVTNGCTDKTEEIIKKRTGSRLKHISLSSANVSRARNYGASKAEGEILVFLDADTLLEPEALQQIKNEFTSEHAVATTLVQPDEARFPFSMLMALKSLNFKTGVYKGCSGVLICRRSVFDAVNGYDPELKIFEHRSLIRKLLEKGEYRCIQTTATTSMRRWKNWGVAKTGFFWARQWLSHKNGKLAERAYETVR